ncbi:cation-transporting P-type ATPase, partial [Chamaesiphon sp. OTE_75_metabat_556]|uniref:cation-transporting P-type ATPase n=1 Tax=Chamaesiphon sp. OTE_75_metabat_556 TaxID=2964692 RepID=UPI00286C987D
MVSPVIRLESKQSDRDPVAGLSERDAIAKLDRDGYNELPSTQARSLLSIAWESIQDPIF